MPDSLSRAYFCRVSVHLYDLHSSPNLWAISESILLKILRDDCMYKLQDEQQSGLTKGIVMLYKIQVQMRGSKASVSRV